MKGPTLEQHEVDALTYLMLKMEVAPGQYAIRIPWSDRVRVAVARLNDVLERHNTHLAEKCL